MLAFPVNIKYNMLHTIYEVIVMADFTYEITEKLGTISQGKNGWSKELYLVSWGGRAPKYDIRDWNEDHSRMRKGVSLTAEEVAVLKEILEEIDI